MDRSRGPVLSIQQQCNLLARPSSTYYYQPRPESEENLRLLRQLDELYMEYPFFGSRRMAVQLHVNRKRVQRLMRIAGIEALYPKSNLSRPAPGHQIDPYLLRGVVIERSDQVWSTDITYIPIQGGFLHLARGSSSPRKKSLVWACPKPKPSLRSIARQQPSAQPATASRIT
jgi:putative transposase